MMEHWTHCQRAREDADRINAMIAEMHGNRELEFSNLHEAMVCAIYDMMLCKHEMRTADHEDWKNYNREMHGAVYPDDHINVAKDNSWHDALQAANMKWIVFLRLKDEVQDAHMDIEAAKVAKTHGNEAIATEMAAMAKTRTANAEKLNARYASLPYTHGTAAEHAKWDKEYAAIIAQHKKNVTSFA